MNADGQEFLHDMVIQLDDTIRKLVAEEIALTKKIGADRATELKEFWKQDLSTEEELEFRRTLDHWDKELLRIWARSKRAHHTRAQVGQTLMKLNTGLQAAKGR